jgi:hypothetical protein
MTKKLCSTCRDRRGPKIDPGVEKSGVIGAIKAETLFQTLRSSQTRASFQRFGTFTENKSGEMLLLTEFLPSGRSHYQLSTAS